MVCYARRKDPTNWGLYSLQYIYYFRTIFFLINYSLRDPHYICPEFFIFTTPICDPRFATHISRLPFATHISRPTFGDSHSRPMFRDPRFATLLATHIRDSHSRLAFATLLATHIHDSRLRLHSRLTFATPDLAPNCDSLFFVATSVV